jgi:hypothetical protein
MTLFHFLTAFFSCGHTFLEQCSFSVIGLFTQGFRIAMSSGTVVQRPNLNTFRGKHYSWELVPWEELSPYL